MEMIFDRLHAGRTTSGRVIDRLRQLYGGTWTYEWPSVWKNADGWEVQAFSRVSIDPGGSESYYTEYRRSDTGEHIFP